MADIERINWPNVDVFKREFVETGTPVIVNCGLGACNAANWTPDYLCSAIGNKRLKVAISPNDGVFAPDDLALTFENMELSAAVSLMKLPSARKYYIMQTPVARDLPELVGEICIPAVIDSTDLLVTNLWLSASGAITPLHYDTSNNLLAQTYGRKEVRLFAPDQYKYLYPLPLTNQHRHVSQINLQRPDFDRFPLFRHALGIRFTLEEGEVLFVPPFWWHEVKSISLSVSLNFWWKIYPPQFFAPIILDQLVELFDVTRFRDVPLNGAGLIATANYALYKRNLAWAACLLAAAALDRNLRRRLHAEKPISNVIPSRLDSLNNELARLQKNLAIDPPKIQCWMRLLKVARQADDSRLIKADIANMVKDISQFIMATA